MHNKVVNIGWYLLYQILRYHIQINIGIDNIVDILPIYPILSIDRYLLISNTRNHQMLPKYQFRDFKPWCIRAQQVHEHNQAPTCTATCTQHIQATQSKNTCMNSINEYIQVMVIILISYLLKLSSIYKFARNDCNLFHWAIWFNVSKMNFKSPVTYIIIFLLT